MKKLSASIKSFILFWVGFACLLNANAQVNITASVADKVVYAGTPFLIVFKVAHGNADSLFLPEISGFASTKSQGSSRNIDYANGIKTETSERYLMVVVDSPGVFEVGEAMHIAGKDTVKSERLSIKVSKPLSEDSIWLKAADNEPEEVVVEEAVSDDRLYFSDGNFMEGKIEMVKACVREFDKDNSLEGLGTSANDVCECILTSVASFHTRKSFLKTLKNSKKFVAKLKDESSVEYRTFYSCVLKGSTLSDKEGNPIDISDDIANNSEVFLKQCEIEAEKSLSVNGVSNKIDVKSYCSCMLIKLTESGFSAEKLKEVLDPNSVAFNETVVPCLLQAQSQNTVERSGDVLGDKKQVVVPLTKLLNTFRLRVAVGSIEKYFILDSGASVTFITSEFEKELVKAGIIQKQHYSGRQKFLMANGCMIDCRLVVLHGVKVGDYVVNNVRAAISETNQPMLLLGKSVLDKFKNWKIDNDTSTLILER